MRQIMNSTPVVALLVVLIISGMAKNQHRDVRKTQSTDTKDGLQLSIELEKESFRLDGRQWKTARCNLSLLA